MANSGTAKVRGETKQWHKITLDFDGPQAKEEADTFLNHRLDVTFRHQGTGETIRVPGYFAADGDAADSGASSGSVWRAHFNPPKQGTWTWEASFRKGDKVAVADSAKAGSSAGAMDGASGSFSVGSSNKRGDDLRGKGMLEYDGDQYLNFAGTDEVFLKSGVGSPENFLAYSGFDNTVDSHDYKPHVKDFNGGDPTWDGGKGKGIIGAINYLAENGVNSAYMLLNTVGGDGRDVWPWSASDLGGIRTNAGNGKGSFNLTVDARSFDVSKLDQWEIVFDHMEKKGIVLHLFFQETENDHLLNNGDVGLERELFIREMVARFSHHNGVIWNMGEETSNSAGQLRAKSDAIKAIDPYDHPVALHTYPSQHNRYEAFKGSDTLDVLAFQTSTSTAVPDLDRFLGGFEKAGRPAVAFLDEPGSGAKGINAEGDPGWQTNHDQLRDVLWKFYMEGGSGAEWYFGYETARGKGGDLAVEDFATRESVYEWSEAAREFFEDLPLERMRDADGLTSGTKGTDQVLADPGNAYAIYLPQGGGATLDLSGQGGTYDVTWHDPLTGAEREGSVQTVSGGSKVSIGTLPNDGGREWAVSVTKIGGGGGGSPKPKQPAAEKPAPIVEVPVVEAPQRPGKSGFDGRESGVHQMKNGLVVMQAEDGDFVLNNASGNKTWDLEKGMKGYKGSGYLMWDTNKDDFSKGSAGKPSSGPLEYTFRIDGDAKDVAGTYYITMRSTKPATGEPHDRNNDFWVAAGDADQGPSGWKKLFFGGSAEKWLWGSTYDVNHKKGPATFTVDGPGEYSVFVAGRSRKAAFDEIHVQKGSKNTDANAPTSKIVYGDGPSKPAPSKPAPEKPAPEKPAPSKPIDQGGDGKGDGGGKGGPVKAFNDVLSFDAGDVAIRGNKGTIEIPAARLLANDKGHDGTVTINGNALDGSVRTTDGGRTVVYTFDAKKFDGLDAFGYRIDGKGADAAGRVYVSIDLDSGGNGGGNGGGTGGGGGGGNGGGGNGGGGGKPAPKPAKPGPDLDVDVGDFTLVDARLNKPIVDLGERAVIEAASVRGMSLDVVADAPGSAGSARMALDGRTMRIENKAPFTLYGDERGDYRGGLDLSEGQDARVSATFHQGANGTGKVVGRSTLAIEVEDGVLSGRKGASDVFVLHERKMGRDTISDFEERDALAFVGGISTKAVLAKADVKGGDTVIDFGGGDVLILKDFTTLGADDILT